MIGDDAVAHHMGTVGIGLRCFRACHDQRTHQVGRVIVMRALKHGGDAFEPHARVNRRLGQRATVAGAHLIELHEHKVPDFDETVAVLVRAAGRAAGDLVAMIEENFRAGTARARVTHRPEIISRRYTDDLTVAQARDLLPQRMRLVIIVIDSRKQPVFRQAEFFGDQIPGKLNRVGLEIITKREVPEHLEESMVTRRVAHIVEVIMLAARPHAFLRRGGAHIGAFFLTGEDVFEGDHAGISEEQRRIIIRHQRAGRDDLMAVLAEIVQIGAADLVEAGHSVCLAQYLLRACSGLAQGYFGPPPALPPNNQGRTGVKPNRFQLLPFALAPV